MFGPLMSLSNIQFSFNPLYHVIITTFANNNFALRFWKKVYAAN